MRFIHIVKIISVGVFCKREKKRLNNCVYTVKNNVNICS